MVLGGLVMGKREFSALLLASCALPCSVFAQQPQVTLDVTVGASVSNNPYLTSDDEVAAAANLGVRPTIIWEDEVATTAIQGNLQLAQYTNRYGRDLSGGVTVSSDRRIDEKTSLNLASSFQSMRSALQGDFLPAGQDPLNPGNDPVPPIPPIDTTIAGLRSRTQAASASLGITHSVNVRSSINAGASFSGAFVNQGAGFDYTNLSGQFGYERRLTERMSLTAGIQASRVDYLDRSTGDSRILTPQLGIRQQLTSQLNLVASAGISYVVTDLGAGTRSKRTSFSGSVGLCNASSTRTACLSASRSTQPTALGGVSSVTSVSANYDVVVSQKERVSFAARYGQTDQNLSTGLPLQNRITEIVGGSATYSRQLNDRLTFSVTPSYSKIYGDNQGRRDSNASIMIGLTMRFGKLG